ncbi:MAG: PGF-CTERM sorting domain-containing protein, partial [archaeon]|nr:PGF-CTERM sorting domain-containing protein [archaeon]
YFGDDMENAEDYTLELPIRVRSVGAGPGPSVTRSAPTTPSEDRDGTGIFGLPGFKAMFAMIGLLIAVLLLTKRRINKYR